LLVQRANVISSISAALLAAVCSACTHGSVAADPSAQSLAGTYAFTWGPSDWQGLHRAFADTVELLANPLREDQAPLTGHLFALGGALAPSEATHRRWGGEWFWEFWADSVRIGVSDSFTAREFVGVRVPDGLEGELRLCGDVRPPFCSRAAVGHAKRIPN